LARHEAEQTEASILRAGAGEFLAGLREQGIVTALATNNSRNNTDFLLRKFGLNFDCVNTRESGLWKPSGAPFLEIMKRLSLGWELRRQVPAAAPPPARPASTPFSCWPTDRFAGAPVEVF
jgi:beta-phosphoglucomutase-like phosphatase (HAD superfamily)